MSQIFHTDETVAPGSARALLRQIDWQASPLGAPATWPVALTNAVNNMLDSAFPSFVAWGDALTFLYNDAYAPILNDRHPQAMARPFQAIWSDIWDDVGPISARAMAGKSSYFEDMPLLMLRNGRPQQTWFTFSYSPLYNGADGVAGMMCTCIETTERVRFEARQAFELKVADAIRSLASPSQVLATSSALLGEEMHLSRVMYGAVDADTATFVVPRDWVRGDRSSMSGQRYRIDAFGPEIEQALRAGQVVRVENTRDDPRTAEHHAVYAHTDIPSFLAVPLIKSGRLVAFLALNRGEPGPWTGHDVRLAVDMAERTWAAVETARAQSALRRERDRSRHIFDTIAEGFALYDRDFTILEMNAEGLRMSMLSADEVIGRNFWEAFPVVLGTPLEDIFRAAMTTRQPGTAEFRQALPDGALGWADVRVYPTPEGGIVAFFRDITEQKLTEEKLRAADQNKDEFLAMLAHELRNPLAPISAAADLLKIGALNETRVRQSSAIIGRQVRHMTSLIDDLLDVSRVTRGLVTLEQAPVDARAIVDDAVEQARPLMQARHQSLTLFLADEHMVVLGDKARLVQVLVNLLNNAAKYTPDHRHIALRALREHGELVISVRDEGIGMDAELTVRVFDLFSQAKRSSDRAQGGLGLGLALVKHLVELHGGTVSCSSPGPGAGSTFTVRLPLYDGLPDAVAAQETAAPDDVRPLRLMVVDDNVDAANTLGMLLEVCGHAVTVAHDSAGALARAVTLRPDVCLLDIGLPDMDGKELARRLRARPETAQTVLIAVTGYGRDEDREEALAAGFRHHLVKPVDLDRLAALLSDIRP